MRANTQITVVAVIAALALGIGIPLFAVIIRPSSEMLAGTVVAVAPGQRALAVHCTGGAKELRGRTVVVRVPAGQKVTIGGGTEDFKHLLAGEHVVVRLRRGSFQAERITVQVATGSSPPTSTTASWITPRG